MAVDNATILDAVRVHLSNDYQQRVPATSQAGVDTVSNQLLSSKTLFNEFAPALVNLIGSQVLADFDYYNPLAAFKKNELLPSGGSIIEEMALGMIKAKGYDIEDTDLFKNNPLDVYANFHQVNREDRYDLTVQRNELQKAFRDQYGLNNFITSMLARPAQSDEYDEFNIMVQLIGRAYSEGHLKKVSTPITNLGAASSDEIKNLSYNIRTYAKKMSMIPSALYNAEGVPMKSTKSDLILITTPEVSSSMDVSVLADAFNIDRADFVQQVVEIPEFPMDGVYAMLVDREWFMCADFLREVDYFWNPQTRTDNYYLHHWGVYSYSKYANAIVFGEEGDEVPVVNIKLDSISAKFVNEDGEEVTTFDYTTKGEPVYVAIDTAGSITPANDNFKLPEAFTVEDIVITNEEGVQVGNSSRTYTDRTHKLYVQKGLEAGTELTVSVQSTYVNPSGNGTKPSPAITSEATITLV